MKKSQDTERFQVLRSDEHFKTDAKRVYNRGTEIQRNSGVKMDVPGEIVKPPEPAPNSGTEPKVKNKKKGKKK